MNEAEARAIRGEYKDREEIPNFLWYAGIWEAIFYNQGDQDVEEKKDERPTVLQRLPDRAAFDYDLRFNLQDFADTLAYIDCEGGIGAWKIHKYKEHEYGWLEVVIEYGCTEGYQGLPDDW